VSHFTKSKLMEIEINEGQIIDDNYYLGLVVGEKK
jgi:hypothetical protein